MDKKLIEEYLKICDDPNSSENDIQDYLEENTELIPLPILENHNLHFNVIISKFRLGNEAITDFAYITKSSNLWRVVLIELENQHNKVFKQTNERVEFSSAFNKGLNQIQSWQIYIEYHKDAVLKSLEKLRCPEHMANNMTYFDYVLIIGRDSELTEKRRKMLSNLMERERIKVMSYDSLISRYTNFSGVNREKVLLAPCKEQGFKIKKLPKGEINTGIFGYVSPDYLCIDKSQYDRLVNDGFEMNEWNEGFALTINDKLASNHLSPTKKKL